MIDFSTLQGLTIPEGVVTQIAKDGVVLWSAIREKVVGSICLRPSADISVGHILYPSNSTSAYLLINEEVSDGSSTYIVSAVSSERSTYGYANPTVSTFKLSNIEQLPSRRYIITSVNIIGATYTTSQTGTFKNELTLVVNGVSISTVVETKQKVDFDHSVPDAIGLINEYLMTTGALPDINITIRSYSIENTDSKGSTTESVSGVTQVYVILGYEEY